MAWNWFNLLRCQQCFGTLILKTDEQHGDDVWIGSLSCPVCRITYPIFEGIAIFGLSSKLASERKAETLAETDWHFNRVTADEHMKFAEISFRTAERIIRQLVKIKPPNENCIVLDLGAGGGVHSCQLVKHGYQVIASDMSLENMAIAQGYIDHGRHFGRLASDCSILPFSDNQFDVLFCKEFVHHLENMPGLFQEFARVLRSSGILALHDPIWPLWRNCPDEAVKFGLHHYHYSSLRYLKVLKQMGFKLLYFLNQRGPVNPARSRLLYLIDSTLVKFLHEQDWDGFIWFKVLRSILLGGSVTFISRLLKKKHNSLQINSQLHRGVEVINANTVSFNKPVITEALKKQIPQLVRILEQVVNESDSTLMTKINQRETLAS